MMPMPPESSTVDAALIEAVRYARIVADIHRNLPRERGIDIAGRTVLELGPGKDFGSPLLLAAMGANMIVADRFLAEWDDSMRPFCRLLRDSWEGDRTVFDRVLADGTLTGVMKTLAQPAEALEGIADGTIEVAVSNAVLEHVYDLEAAAAELWRVSRPGAWHFHQIDLRDHRDFNNPLEYLLYDAAGYRTHQERCRFERGCQWRASEFQAAFAAQGFQVVDMEVTLRVEEAYLAAFLPRLRASGSRYADWPEGNLRVIGARLVLRRAT